MASLKKRENPLSHEEPQSKKSKNPSPEITPQNIRVALNPADCDLAFNIEGDGLTGHALFEEGFAYCWSGARGNVGIIGGKYCFGCRIVSFQPVVMEDTPPEQQNVCRIGISRGDDPVGNLGETEHSYGFGGTGKFSNASRFVDYGEKFGIGDAILCLVNLESGTCGTIEFCKNGRRLGIAKRFDAGPSGLGVINSPAEKLSWESALFPHVLLKNTVVEMQFSMEDGLVPEEGYKPWSLAVKEQKAVVGPSVADPTSCEVIMMVGLPASGKTTWAEKWVKEHPEKRYVLLGTNLALEQMKVPGLLRKHNYGERFDRLMDRATRIFNTLLSRACKVPRNYIIDQTNVYKSARKRKLKPFAMFHKIAVVVFPRKEEIKFRSEKRFKEMGKEVPPEAVNEMLANFVLPLSKDMRGTDEYFDQVIFTELNRSEAQQILDEMKRTLPSSTEAKPNIIPSSYSRGSSVHSDSSVAAFSMPSSGHTYSGYSVPSVGVALGVTGVGHPEHMHPYPANVNTGYTGYSPPSTVGVQPYQAVNTGYTGYSQPITVGVPYQANVNTRYDSYDGTYTSYTNPVPRKPVNQPGGVHNPYSRPEAIQPDGSAAVNLSNSEVSRTAYLPSYGPLPQGTQIRSPYGHPDPAAYGNPNPGLYRPPNPVPYGTYPADVQHPGGTTHGPPSYY